MFKYIRRVALLLLVALSSPAFATIQYSTAQRNANVTNIVTLLGATGYLMILTGSQPASVATVDSNTEIVDLPLSATAGTVSGGVLTFNPITSENAVAMGTAGHWLLCNTSVVADCVAASSTTRVAQGSVAVSGGDLNFAGGVSFVVGETISVPSFSVTANGA